MLRTLLKSKILLNAWMRYSILCLLNVITGISKVMVCVVLSWRKITMKDFNVYLMRDWSG